MHFLRRISGQRHVSKLSIFNLLPNNFYFGFVVCIEALVQQIELVHDSCNCNLRLPLGFTSTVTEEHWI